VARPPVATERLARLEDGRLLYRLKHRWRDGTTHVVFEPQELVEKLAALVPPPRFHLVRYHGILGPCASERDRIVPAGTASQPRHRTSAPPCLPSPLARPDARPRSAGRQALEQSLDPHPQAVAHEGAQSILEPGPHRDPSPRPRRLGWADLLRRVFAIDVLECPRCGGRMRLVAAIHAPDTTQTILECLDLPSRAPPMAAPQLDDAENGVCWAGDFGARF